MSSVVEVAKPAVSGFDDQQPLLISRGSSKLTSIAVILLLIDLFCTLLVIVLDDSLGAPGYYPMTALATLVLAIALLGISSPPEWRWAHVLSKCLAGFGALFAATMLFFSLPIPGWYSAQQSLALTLGLRPEVDAWRPSISSMIMGVLFSLAVLFLYVPRRWAAWFTAFVFMSGLIVAFWSLGLLLIPSYFPEAANRGTTVLGLMLLFISLVLGSLAGILLRPYRPPMTIMRRFNAWPLITVAVVIAVVGLVSTWAAYRISAQGLDTGVQFVVFFLQILIITSLGVLAFWFVAYQQQRSMQRAHTEGAVEMLLESTEKSPIPTALLAADGVIIDANRAFEQLVASHKSDIRGLHYSALMADPPNNPFDQPWWEEVLAGRTTWTERREYVSRLGKNVWTDVIVVSAQVHDKAPRVVIEQFIDVTLEVEAEQKVQFLSSHDSLTQLLHPESFIAAVQQRRHESFTILVVNIDRFTLFVNSLGVTVANRLLQEVANLLQSLYPHLLIARNGADEFWLLVPDNADEVAEQLLAVCDAGVTVDTTVVRVGLSIGLAPSLDDSHDVLRSAAAAMRRAKKYGGHQVCVYDPEQDIVEERALSVIDDFRSALRGENGHIEAWLQPIVDLPATKTVGFEALARWVHPEQGIINAAEWIELIELEPQLVHELAVIITAQVEEFAEQYEHECFITINISGTHVASSLFPDFAASLIDTQQRMTSKLIVELTETTLDKLSSRTHDILVQLNHAGIHLWADDFGTGYSSLAHLRDLPISGIKLDKSFTSQLSPNNSAVDGLVTGLASLADELSLMTIAEGVETEYQAAKVHQTGWIYGQGWHFGRPQPASSFLQH